MGETKKNKLISREEFRNIASGVAAEVVMGFNNNDIIEDLREISSFAMILNLLEKALFDEKEEKIRKEF